MSIYSSVQKGPARRHGSEKRTNSHKALREQSSSRTRHAFLIDDEEERRPTPESVKQSNEMLDQGKDFLIKKNYKEAIASLTKAIKFNKQNIEAKLYRAVSFLDSGNPKRTLSVCIRSDASF